jgi:hypothetical protein
MRRVAILLAVLSAGCMEEKSGPGAATPISPTSVPARAPGPPGMERPTPPAPAPEPVVAAAPAAPSVPSGLTRVKLGDMVEFSWSRLGETVLDQNAAMALVMGSHDPHNHGSPKLSDPADPAMQERMKKLKGLPPPKALVKTGTLTLVRVEPETPFTFKLEIKSGKDSAQKLFAYGSDIAIEKVFFRTDPEDPKKKAKAAGTTFDCVETQSRLIAPDVGSLALAGGLVTETSPETRVGAVSVALTKVGTASTAGSTEKPKMLDTFETPITIAMQQVEKFGIVDPEERMARDAKLQVDLAGALTKCFPSLKPNSGRIEGVISGGKLESLQWMEKPVSKVFDKCARAAIKGIKLPAEQTFIDIPVGGDE